MPKRQGPSVVSANELMSGDAIFRARSGWTRNINEAVVVEGDALAALLAAAEAEPHVAVGPYAVEVSVAAGRVTPVANRERMRVFGPTVGALNPDLSARHLPLAA